MEAHGYEYESGGRTVARPEGESGLGGCRCERATGRQARKAGVDSYGTVGEQRVGE